MCDMEFDSALLRSLEEIGLSDKEARVYLALLSLESATAYRVAERCGIKRPTVYVTLDDLRKKGLALKVPHAKKALFSAKNIREYVEEQRAKVRTVEQLLPQFEQLRTVPGANVYFYSGIAGMQEALQHKLEQMRGKTFVSFYGTLTDSDPRVTELYSRWDAQAVNADIRFKILRESSAVGGFLIDLKHLSPTEQESIEMKSVAVEGFPGNISFEVGNDFIRIDDAKHLHATIIDNKNAADALRKILEALWDSAPHTSIQG